MSKKNCWEFKNCGRELNGAKVEELGICPSSTEEVLDGVHGGMNAGRACWVVAGTISQSRPQGIFAMEHNNCLECDFYNSVREAEGPAMEMSLVLFNKIRKSKEVRNII